MLKKIFYIKAGKAGWKKNEPVWSQAEIPALFELLVFRAVSENEITVQKGAELLKQSYDLWMNIALLLRNSLWSILAVIQMYGLICRN